MQLSWKVILAPFAGALFTWLGAKGLTLTPDQQASAIGLGAGLVTFLGHYWHEYTQKSTPPTTVAGK